MSQFNTILITGASNGIGRALAISLAKPGIFMAISGRRAADLLAVAKTCENKGADVLTKVIDVTNQSAMRNWIETIDKNHPLELVIANAGVSNQTADKIEKSERSRRMIDINISGVLNTVEPILPKMILRKYGTIALMSSLAGFSGMPSAPAYSASKAWVRSYGEGLRGSIYPSGVKVSVICPGFVKSNITRHNNFFMPFIMTGEKAANVIVNGLKKNKARIAFPFILYTLILLLAVLPSHIACWLLRQLPRKE